MFCRRCGKEVLDDSKFCKYCGAKVSNEIKDESIQSTNASSSTMTSHDASTMLSPKKKINGYAISGLIFAFIIPLLGWILGGIGLSKSKKTGSGKSLSIAAIIVSCLIFIINLLI